MTHVDKNLDFIFIRAQNEKGKWVNLTIRELNKEQWESYLKRKFGEGKQFWESRNSEVEKEEWTDEDKLGMVNWLTKSGMNFIMFKNL